MGTVRTGHHTVTVLRTMIDLPKVENRHTEAMNVTTSSE